MSDGVPTSYRELISVLDSIALLCREKRRRNGLSIREAGRQVGVSFATISRMEGGEDVALSTATKLLSWLDGSQP